MKSEASRSPLATLRAEAIARQFWEGKGSLVSFRRSFLPGQEDSDSAWFHHEWDRILLRGERSFVVQGFRECAKSSLCIRAHTLYRLCYPSREYDYVVFILATQTKATNKLKEIAQEYLGNPVLCANLLKVHEQNENAFDVSVSYGDESYRVRFEAYGKGASIRGLNFMDRRPKLVIIDDPQDMQDATSDLTLERDWDWFLNDVQFLGRTTRIFLIGNNLGARCMTQRAMDNAELLGFESLRIPILNEAGDSNWPGRFPVEQVLAERDAYALLGKADSWYRERMCQPLSPGSQRFTPEMVRFYEPRDVERMDLNTFVTVDLAIGQSASADYTVVCTVGENEENQWFVLDMDYGRDDPSETLARIFDAVHRHGPLQVGVEKVAYQAALLHFLEKEMPRRNRFFQVKPLVADKKKELRIEALQPRFKTGTIWLPRGASWLGEFLSELYSFPNGAHDDLIDALAYQEQVVYPCSRWKKPRRGVEIPVAGRC